MATHCQRLGFFAGIGFKTGDENFFDVLLGKALDVLHEAFFVQAHQADGLAAVAGAARAANAVNVVFTDVRDFVVDDVRQLVDVDAACGNVSRHQRTDVAVFKALQGLGAGGLALVAVQGHRGNPGFGQMLGHVVGAEFGAREHQHLAPVVLVDDVREQRFFLAATDRVNGLGDALHRGVARRDLDRLGVFEQAVGQFADFVAEGGAEQQ